VDDGRRVGRFCGTLEDVSVTSRRTTPRRLVLRPGVHVLRRSADELQVGLDPRRALILADRPAVRATLASLSSPGATPPEQYDAATVDLLGEAGLLVDADRLLPLVPTGAATEVPRADVAALAASDGDAAARLLAARRATTVEVLTAGSAEADTIAGTLIGLVTAAGVRCVGAAGPVRRRPSASSAAPSAGVLVCVGEPAREELDGWMRTGRPHLLLRLSEGAAVVGPFVIPGETACLRCLDGHHADVDPAWPLLVAQHGSAALHPRDDTVPEPVDSVLAVLAAAWAAREVVSHAEGRSPATTSTTIRLDPHLTCLETRTWSRHHGCGCSGL
jgi:bacteriocin biosynthesis cyclodehydratase domain-containing protein